MFVLLLIPLLFFAALLGLCLFTTVQHNRTGSSPYLWSKGWDTTAYGRKDTETRSDLTSWQGPTEGLIWIRMGSVNVQKQVDLISFATHVLPLLTGPTVLISTDGDMSVPADLPPETTQSILSCPQIKAWYTQNLTPAMHDKLHPLPIGFDLHTIRTSRFHTVTDVARLLTAPGLAPEQRIPRIWCDVHHTQNSSYRKTLKRLLPTLTLVDTATGYIPAEELWEKYGMYRYVLSLPGNGLDCHRTWEALAKGATVLTHKDWNPFVQERIVMFEDWSQLNDPLWLEQQWQLSLQKTLWHAQQKPYKDDMKRYL